LTLVTSVTSVVTSKRRELFDVTSVTSVTSDLAYTERTCGYHTPRSDDSTAHLENGRLLVTLVMANDSWYVLVTRWLRENARRDRVTGRFARVMELDVHLQSLTIVLVQRHTSRTSSTHCADGRVVARQPTALVDVLGSSHNVDSQ
jgi:hypothetical protein